MDTGYGFAEVLDMFGEGVVSWGMMLWAAITGLRMDSCISRVTAGPV